MSENAAKPTLGATAGLQFVNCKGELVYFPPDTSLGALIKAGVRVWMVPKDAPKSTDPAVFSHSPEPQ